MRAALLLVCACALDYKEPLAGSTAAGGIEMCRENPLLPCGWVYQCANDTEWCLPWPDRALIPKQEQMLESLNGQCEVSTNPRFHGTPLCLYQCPSQTGCNAYNGCFCLDEVP